MNALSGINTQYEKAINKASVLKSYEEAIALEINKADQDEKSKSSKAVDQLSALFKKTDLAENDLLLDTFAIATQYMNCVNSIEAFKSILLKSKQGNTPAVYNALSAVRQGQAKYDVVKDDYYHKYKYNVNSIGALNSAIMSSLQVTMKSVQDEIESLKEEARTAIGVEYTTELKRTDPITSGDTLPTQFLAARFKQKDAPLTIMQDLGIGGTYENLYADLKTQGNTILITDFEHIDDRRIDEFIIAYILRFLESFPPGTINVHIFDQNANYLYKRLSNSFQSENAGEMTKKVVQLHSALNDLAIFRDVICEDIFKKTSVEKPDLYAIYEEDRTDPFNLVILRNGLVDGSGYASTDILEIINSLTKPDETGHKCGMRFLIVDDSASFEKNLSVGNKHLISSIEQNCAFKMGFNKATGFSTGEKNVEVLHIAGDFDAYLEERSKLIAATINSKAKSLISIDEVSANEIAPETGNIMFIPVGKSGGSIVELPFSCKDEDGTVAGQCIGYMAIGQSGSGKSSFFHSLVLNGCMKYSPRDLQFWLLDFKNGGASSKYSNCGIPHIRIIAENNKIDDALCLFQMVLEEMERRTKAFNKSFTDNIIEYNKKADGEGLEHFPRIIIAIDEVQEIFREDNASVLQKLISSIATRMRSAGMHFVMVAQNLSEGKSYMLKDAFMPSATGRICFRVAQDIPRDSGFEDDFIQRKQEISELKTGEAYVSYGRNTIKKVKMAFVSPQDMSDKVFADIRNKYREYSELRPRVIGSRTRLSITSQRQDSVGSYKDVLAGLRSNNEIYDVVLGEDVYRMSPFHIQFSQYDNSSVLLLGSDKQMSSSMCSSVALSLIRQNVQVHLFNADRTKTADGNEVVPHSFMYICQNLSGLNSRMQNYRLDQFKDVVKTMYSEYLSRQSIIQKADEEDLDFPAVVLIVNDLFGIESFIRNEIVDGGFTEEKTERPINNNSRFDYDIFSNPASIPSHEEGRFTEGVQSILSTLLKNGYRYNLHLVLAIKGDPMTWRTGRTVGSMNNTMLFNDTEYAEQFDNSFYIKEMLKNISNDGDEETVAVWVGKKSLSKIRPVIYKMSNLQEKEALISLLKAYEEKSNEKAV